MAWCWRWLSCRADQHWQQVVYRHVLQCWQDKATTGAAKWQSLAKALCFCKQQLLTKALAGWAEGMQQQQEARAAAAAAFQELVHGLELQSAAAALQAWSQAAQVQAGHRRLLETASAARHQLRRRQVRHWFLGNWCLR
jgi:hypothetical protein